MFVIVGLIIVFASLIIGFTMAGGHLLVLVQPSEFVTIGGAAIGSMLVANPLPTVKKIIGGVLGSLKGARVSKKIYKELFQMMYELFQFAKKEGLIALEPHVEDPSSSAIISKYPSFLANHHAKEFFCDTLKVVLSGGVPAHDLEELMDIDLEALHEEEAVIPAAVNTVGDAFPALGIVAAVLGIIVTMGSISDGPEAVGHHVGAALVGTFLGVLLSYGVVGPIAKNMDLIVQKESKYMNAIKAALVAFSKGSPATIAVEYARRSVDPENRPTFKEVEEALKETK